MEVLSGSVLAKPIESIISFDMLDLLHKLAKQAKAPKEEAKKEVDVSFCASEEYK
jgi:hypothetical protein